MRTERLRAETIVQSTKNKFPVTKYKFKTYDGHLIEAIHVNHEKKHIICFSCQVGCPVGCRFCNAGRFTRNLNSDEMVHQCEYIAQNITSNGKQLLFSCMGVGEPSLNAQSLRKAFTTLNKRHPSSRFALSTLGIDPIAVRGLANIDLDIKFQLSIHAIKPEQRERIFGFNLPLDELLNLRGILQDLDQSYMLIKGINDGNEDAILLARTCGDHPIKINHFNPIEKCEFESSERVDDFISILKAMNCQVEYYETDGYDIEAACGQLTGGIII